MRCDREYAVRCDEIPSLIIHLSMLTFGLLLLYVFMSGCLRCKKFSCLEVEEIFISRHIVLGYVIGSERFQALAKMNEILLFG